MVCYLAKGGRVFRDVSVPLCTCLEFPPLEESVRPRVGKARHGGGKLGGGVERNGAMFVHRLCWPGGSDRLCHPFLNVGGKDKKRHMPA